MATGFQMDYTDPNTGLNLPQAWVQLGPLVYSPAGEVYVQIVAYVYENQAAYQAGKNPVFNLRPVLNQATDPDDFNTYFAESVLNNANVNFIGQSLVYLQNTLS